MKKGQENLFDPPLFRPFLSQYKKMLTMFWIKKKFEKLFCEIFARGSVKNLDIFPNIFFKYLNFSFRTKYFLLSKSGFSCFKNIYMYLYMSKNNMHKIWGGGLRQQVFFTCSLTGTTKQKKCLWIFNKACWMHCE